MPDLPYQPRGRDRLHVTCAADSKYGAYAGIALTSVLRSNSDCEVHVHLLSDGIKQKDIVRIEGVVGDFNGKLSVYDMQEKLNAHPALRVHAHYTRAAYIRLFIPDIVPSNVDWIVYMDCDVICVKSWRELWSRREEVPVVGGVVDQWVNRDRSHKESLGIPAEQTYYGSGVLLINVETWRKRKLGEKLLAFVQSREPMRYVDQDAINYILGAEITELPAAWNALVTSPHHQDMSHDMEQAINIHYCSNIKPWHLGYRLVLGTGADAFAKAKARSPWRWRPPELQIQRMKRKLLQVLAFR